EAMGRQLFLTVGLDDRKYFEEPLLSREAASCFPAADQELQEAGKCFALDRHSATVYHSMRALEVGLLAIARRLGVDLGNKPWGKLISNIEEKIRGAWADYRGGYDEEKQSFLELCSEAATHFRFLKD